MVIPIINAITIILVGFSLPMQADTSLVSLHNKQVAGQVLYHSGRVMVEASIIATIVEAGMNRWNEAAAYSFGGIALAGFLSTQTGLLMQNISIQRYNKAIHSIADQPEWGAYILGWVPALLAAGLTTVGSIHSGFHTDGNAGAYGVAAALLFNTLKDVLWIRNSILDAKYAQSLSQPQNLPDISFIPVFTSGGSKGIALSVQY